MDLATLLPPWVGILAAILSHGILHYLSLQTVEPTSNPHNTASFVIWSGVNALAGFLQYLLPVVFLLGAAVSYCKRKKREQLADDVRTRANTSALL